MDESLGIEPQKKERLGFLFGRIAWKQRTHSAVVVACMMIVINDTTAGNESNTQRSIASIFTTWFRFIERWFK